MWASGLAAGGAVVAWWNVVGKGYVWLTASVVALVGVALALVEPGVVPWVGTALAATAVFFAGNRQVVTGLLAGSAVALLFVGTVDASLIPLITGAVFLGFVTTEMMLGHWFLVDPTLPRWSLNRLALIGGGGLLGSLTFAGSGLLATKLNECSWMYVM